MSEHAIKPPTTKFLLIVLASALVAHLILLLDFPFDFPYALQSLAALLLAGILPALLVIQLLFGVGNEQPPWGERALYTIGLGYSILVLLMLLLSYIPGPLYPWQAYLTVDGLLLLLLWWSWRRAAVSPRFDMRAISPWIGAGLMVLFAIGGFMRLVHMGYAEFHGDEARAVLRAAAVIQGYDDVLWLHKKGPTEILLPTAIFAFSGHINEAAARLPFTLANLAALGAVYLLGRRMFGSIAGWSTAMLLALDGYFIGFARIIQYQSIIILTAALVILILYRLTRHPKQVARHLILASVLLATGLLSHYEAALVMIPALYLLSILFDGQRGKSAARHMLQRMGLAVGGAILVGGTLLAIFYVPFTLHPNFRATYAYLTERRISGDGFPYNNVVDFFTRTTLYSTTYYILLLTVLTAAALIALYLRRWGPWRGGIAGLLLIVGLVITFWQPIWLQNANNDYLVLFFLLALLPAWFIRQVGVAERTLWLWFGVGFLLALFFIAKPRTHVYIFFTPWVLLAGMMLERGWQMLKRAATPGFAHVAGVATAAALILLFGIYAYWYFVYIEVEILRTWQQNRLAGYWTTYDVLDNRALFGFPLANGWKVVGMLYAENEIAGSYATNEVEYWTPAWYTRGQVRCEDEAEWVFQIGNPQPDPEGYERALAEYLSKEYRQWGEVTIFDTPRMLIHRRSQTPFDVRSFALSDYAAAFDATATPDLPLGYPVVEPEIPNPLHVNLGNLIWLEGYDLEYETPLAPGDPLRLTLYWRAQQPIPDSYKVFNQSFYGDGVMVAQRDGYPICGYRGTWLWDPGELIVDVHQMHVEADAPNGLYPLFTGLYIEETFERLDVLDESGNPVADRVHLTDIRVGEE